MNSRKYKISTKDIYFLFVILIFLKPQICEDIPTLDFLFNAFRFILSIVYSGIVIARSINRQRFNKDLIIMWMLGVTVFIATSMFGKNYPKALTHYIPSIGFVSFLYYYEARISDILALLQNMGLVLLVANLISFFVFPNGMMYRSSDNLKIWILGQKQDLGGFLLCFVFTSLCLFFLNGKKYENKFKLVFILSFITTALEKSIGLLFCLLLLFILIVFDKYVIRIKREILISGVIIGIILLVYICYNIENMPALQRVLSSMGFDGITKLRTANVRFGMWKFAFDLILSHPIIGVGNLSVDIWQKYTNIGYHSMLDNMYFDVLLTGGIIGIILFAMLIRRNFVSYKEVWKIKTGRNIGYCIFTLYILLMESCPYTPAVFMILTSQIWNENIIAKRLNT